MGFYDHITRFDQAVIDHVFQPVQDVVSGWRGRSDHLLALIALLADAIVWLTRHGIIDRDLDKHSLSLALLLLCWSVMGAVTWFYGSLLANSNAPGVFARSHFVRVFLCLVWFAVVIVPVAINEADGLSSQFLVLNGLTPICFWYFAAVTLKRPPPPKPKEERAALPQAA